MALVTLPQKSQQRKLIARLIFGGKTATPFGGSFWNLDSNVLFIWSFYVYVHA